MVQLPIENSNLCWVKDFSEYLAQQDGDAFSQYFLPETKLNLQKIPAWLNHSEAKKKALIFLDPKVNVTDYVVGLRGIFPASIEVKVEETETILSQLQEFLV